jgi:hypothetical protein
VVLTHYDRTRSDDLDLVDLLPWIDHVFETIQWDLGQPGTWYFDECWGRPGWDLYYGWNTRSWGSNGVGSEFGGLVRGPDVCGQKTINYTAGYTVTTGWQGEFCDVSAQRYEVGAAFSIWERTRDRRALTLFELRTGGKARSRRQSLFVLSGNVEGVGNPFWPEIDWNNKAGYAIDPASVVLGSLGRQGSDGKLYKALPDGKSYDITPIVSENPYYTYGPTQSKHKLRIRANGAICNFDELLSTPTFCVGQKVTFTSDWDQTPSDIQNETNKWDFGGTFVNDSTQRCAQCSVDYTKNPSRLTSETTFAWWVSGAFLFPASYPVTLSKGLTFSNGQHVVVPAEGSFNMHRPKTDVYAPLDTKAKLFYREEARLALGAYSDPGGFAVIVESAFSGLVGITQLIAGYATNAEISAITSGTNMNLDVQEFFTQSLRAVPAHGNTNTSIADRANILCNSNTAIHFDFKDYVRFKPGIELDDGNIFITLGTANWHVHAATELVLVPGTTNQFDYTPLPPPPPAAPVPRDADPGDADTDDNLTDSDEFPRWEYIAVPP